MQNPIGWLVSSNTNGKYNRIGIFKDSQILIGLNDHEGFEIQYDQIRFNMAVLEHKINMFILQSISNCCHIRGKRMVKDGLLILNEDEIVRFQYCQRVWEYRLVFGKFSTSKYSKLKAMIEDDNLFLDQTLQCGICLDVYQQPVQLQCKHSFCGHCITYWMDLQSDCPTCRIYLRKYPEKAKPLEIQWFYEQENRYQYEYNVNYRYSNNQDADQMIDEQDQIDVVQEGECKSCDNLYKDFNCQPDQWHVQCCNYFMPIRELDVRENAKYQMFCQICKKYGCKYYYKTQCHSVEMYDLLDWSKYIIFSYKRPISKILQNKIQECLKGLPIDYIITYLIHNCVIQEQFYLEGQQKQMVSDENELLLIGSPICYDCMRDVFSQIVIKFMELNRITFTMPNCQQGIHCQLQYEENNEYHVNNYNHLCRRQV